MANLLKKRIKPTSKTPIIEVQACVETAALGCPPGKARQFV
jgi:hypothetical protein